MTVKRQVAGSNLVSDDFSNMHPTYLPLGLCGYLGTRSKLGRNLRTVTQTKIVSPPLSTCKSNYPNLAAKRKVKSLTASQKTNMNGSWLHSMRKNFPVFRGITQSFQRLLEKAPFHCRLAQDAWWRVQVSAFGNLKHTYVCVVPGWGV
jgi:hypothetical protein